MKTIWKRLAGVFLTACMVMAMVPALPAAAATSGDGWSFDDTTGTLTVTTNAGTINWRTETEGPDKASVLTVSIEGGVTSIANQAFISCTNLTAVTIPDSVTSIGISAFQGCTSLTDITIPDSVTSIGSSAFYGCTGLTSITIPGSVTSIGAMAFYGCTSLTGITVASENQAFLAEDGVLFDAGKTKLLQYPAGKTGITTYDIPASVEEIAGGAFARCTSLNNITIPNSVTSISESAFDGCTSLTSITIPDSVEYIGSSAFDGCTSLVSVEFLRIAPPTLGGGVFWNVPSGLKITVPAGKVNSYTTALEGKLPAGATIIEKSSDQIPDETDLDASSPSTPSTPYIPPVTVNADTAAGSTIGAKLEMKASQLPSGVEASDVTFVAKAVSAPAKLASTTLASIPNLPTAKSITVFDLDLLLKSSGEKVDFTGKVTVSIPMPAGYGSFLRVFHVANDGTMTEVPAVINGSNILLTLEHFSHYAVVDFASPAGKLPTKLTASAAVTTAATTAKPSEGGNNAGKNPTTGAMPPLLAIIGCAGAGMVAVKAHKKA